MANKMHTTETTEYNGKTYYTRHWYMNCGKAMDSYDRHDMFYRQFCTPSILSYVRSSFNNKEWERIRKADDHKYLNGIFEIKRWDRVCVRDLIKHTYTACCYAEYPKGVSYWALNDNTCIVKAAVRMLLEQEGNLKDWRALA